MKNPAAKSITYSYDANSNRSLMIDPDGGRFTYSYDNRGLLDVLLNPQSDRTTFSYDANGQRTLKKLANGTRASHTYDAVGNLDKLFNFKSDNSVISSFDYSNNAVNNRTSVAESSGDRVTWTYDNTSQLLSEQRSGANSYAHTFSYDEAGNRRTKKEDTVLTTFTFDVSNQLKTMLDASGTTTYTFDNNGNQRTTETPGNAVTTNTWDFENHLTVIEQPAVDNITYAYNPDGLRIEKDNQGTITKFLWDDQAYLAETDSGDTTTVVYSNEPLAYGNLISQRRSTNTSFLHFDALGSTRELTASDESITDTLIYDAWGEDVNRTGATNVDMQFVGSQGYYRDTETDLFYIRNRYLDSGQASWLSLDPLGYIDGLNMFRYSSNNPVLFIDPSGNRVGSQRRRRPYTGPPTAAIDRPICCFFKNGKDHWRETIRCHKNASIEFCCRNFGRVPLWWDWENVWQHEGECAKIGKPKPKPEPPGKPLTCHEKCRRDNALCFLTAAGVGAFIASECEFVIFNPLAFAACITSAGSVVLGMNLICVANAHRCRKDCDKKKC